MVWELKKVEDQRKKLLESYLSGNRTMTELCEYFGVSRKTGYKWLERYRKHGTDGLKDQSKALNIMTNLGMPRSERIIT